MKRISGLKVKVEEQSGPQRTAFATYVSGNPDSVEVRLEPSMKPRGATFVRTASIHFDIDSNGDLSVLEILGPPQSAWKICDLHWPEGAKAARIRFREPEQCEEGVNEIFEKNRQGDILRIIFISRPVIQHVEPARDLLFGIDDADELVEVWIRGIAGGKPR